MPDAGQMIDHVGHLAVKFLPGDDLARREAACLMFAALLAGPRSTAAQAAIEPQRPAARAERTNPPAWQALPPTPQLPPPRRSGLAPVNGTLLFVAEYGDGDPVLMLHGGLANSNWWGHQIGALAPAHRVVVIDTRGHGRSRLNAATLSYDLMAEDVIAVMDHLRIPRASIVGWSDGAIVGLLLAIRRPERIARLFAFGANTNTSGLLPGGARTATFVQFARRCAREYASLAPDRGGYPALLSALRRMWAREPNIPAAELRGIRVPATIACGQHDEIIRPEHSRALQQLIPAARLVVQPGVSHFAMLQDPARFSRDLLAFLA